MGNICRSPTAEGVLRKCLAARGWESLIEVDSAGTHDYHIGCAPDPRTVAAAARRGVDLSPLRARQVSVEDFRRFDYILAMDGRNLRGLQALLPADATARVELYLNYSRQYPGQEVPDPYYGGPAGFEEVLSRLEDASDGFLAHLAQRFSL